MAPLRHAVHILPDVMMASRQSADPGDTTAFAPLEPRLKLLADDLTWWARRSAPPAGTSSRKAPAVLTPRPAIGKGDIHRD